MISMEHPWAGWMEEDNSSNEIYNYKLRKDTPEDIKKQYEEWQKYYNEKMKM